MTALYNGKNTIPYEHINKPYFASLKNAFSSLNNTTADLYNYEEFLEFIEKCYPKEAENIELVRFYDFTWTFDKKYGDNFRFHLSVIYIKPCGKTRDTLFSNRDKITKYTGWYPYIVGSRANVTKTKHKEFIETYKN